MILIRANLPDDVHAAIVALAARERVSVEELVTRTLKATVALPLVGLTFAERGARGDWADFDRIMERVPDVPPLPGDHTISSFNLDY